MKVQMANLIYINASPYGYTVLLYRRVFRTYTPSVLRIFDKTLSCAPRRQTAGDMQLAIKINYTVLNN